MTAEIPEPIVFDSTTSPYREVSGAELDATRTAGSSPLEQLAEKLSRPAKRAELLRKKIPLRPDVGMVFDPNLVDSRIRQVWTDRAKTKARQTGNRAARRSRLTGDDTAIDPLTFACLALAHTNVAVTVDGAEVPGLTLADERLWGMVGQVDPEQAIRALYGLNDQHIESQAGEIILASGIDDDIEDEEGPTGAS